MHEAVLDHLSSRGDHQDDDEFYNTGGAGLLLSSPLQYSELETNTYKVMSDHEKHVQSSITSKCLQTTSSTPKFHCADNYSFCR
jgi:hypothetical protein